MTERWTEGEKIGGGEERGERERQRKRERERGGERERRERRRTGYKGISRGHLEMYLLNLETRGIQRKFTSEQGKFWTYLL